MLRALLIKQVPESDRDVLNKYPLAGVGKKPTEKKFLLGDLTEHRNKQVGDLIKESVQEYLEEYGSFNDLGQVKVALKTCGIPEAVVNQHNFGELPAMIIRRHNIVHRADRNDKQGGRGNHPTKPIRLQQAKNYLSAVKDLKTFVITSLIS